MQVYEHGPQFWFLLKDGNDYYLSVRCEQSFVGFEMLLRLNPNEYREYHACGRVYIDYLATRVNYWASEYQSRNLQQKMGAQVHEVIMAWLVDNPGANS